MEKERCQQPKDGKIQMEVNWSCKDYLKLKRYLDSLINLISKNWDNIKGTADIDKIYDIIHKLHNIILKMRSN